MLLSDDLEHRPVLNEEYSRRYIRERLGLRFIQTTEDMKPYMIQTGEFVSVPSDLALLEAISKQEGEPPRLISSKKAIELYTREGLEEVIGDPDSNAEHYQNLKGTNKFDTARPGVVIGNPFLGDEPIEKWAALARRSVQRLPGIDGKRSKGRGINFGPFGNRLLQR